MSLYMSETQKNWRNVMQPLCPRCGSILEYDANQKEWHCPVCGKKVRKVKERYKKGRTAFIAIRSLVGGLIIFAIIIGFLNKNGALETNKEDGQKSGIMAMVEAIPETVLEGLDAKTDWPEATEQNALKSLIDSRKANYSNINFQKTEERTFQYTTYDETQIGTITYSSFPVEAAAYYGTLQRYGLTEWKKFLDDELNKGYCESLAKYFKENAASDFEAVANAICFVQSLDYLSDEGVEYPKYPIETLCDKGGDCEDKAILLCGIIRSLGYGSALIIYEGHCAVGLLSDNMDGSYFEQDGNKYYYVETTSPGWKIGKVPDEFAGLSARLILVQ